MLSRRTATALLLAAAVLLAIAPAPGAQAQDAEEDCWFVHDSTSDDTEYFIWTCGADWSGGGGDGGTRKCFANVGHTFQVPCSEPTMGWFIDDHGGCYIRPKVPQPPPDDDVWKGNDPSEDLAYQAYCFALEGVDGHPYALLPATLVFPLGDTPVGDLVERAISQLELDGVDIRLAPDPSGAGLVGLPVWMWTEPTASTWGPARTHLTALDLTVFVEANAEYIVWTMGDGTEVRCDGPGTPYQPSFGADESPDCGHRYEEPSRSHPDRRYPVTATTHWRIEWRIDRSAVRGSVPVTREASASVRINELQVVTS